MQIRIWRVITTLLVWSLFTGCASAALTPWVRSFVSDDFDRMLREWQETDDAREWIERHVQAVSLLLTGLTPKSSIAWVDPYVMSLRRRMLEADQAWRNGREEGETAMAELIAEGFILSILLLGPRSTVLPGDYLRWPLARVVLSGYVQVAEAMGPGEPLDFIWPWVYALVPPDGVVWWGLRTGAVCVGLMEYVRTGNRAYVEERLRQFPHPLVIPGVMTSWRNAVNDADDLAVTFEARCRDLR